MENSLLKAKNITGLFFLLMIVGFAQKAQGFSLIEGITLDETERWDRNQVSNRGLAGTLNWNFEENFLDSLNFAEGNITAVELTTSITNAFNVWEVD